MTALLTPSAIIFDFDGVIADSEVVAARAMSRALTQAGLRTSPDKVMERYFGFNRADTLAAINSHWGARTPVDIEQRLFGDAWADPAEPITPIAGVAGFIVATAHLPRAIGSSSGSAYIRGLLEQFGMAAHFGDHVYSGGEHVTRGKPHPDIYLYAAAALGVAPGEAVIIEDSPVGVRAAVASGARVIGLCAGQHCRADHGARLCEAGAHHIAHDYAQVGALLGL